MEGKSNFNMKIYCNGYLHLCLCQPEVVIDFFAPCKEYIVRRGEGDGEGMGGRMCCGIAPGWGRRGMGVGRVRWMKKTGINGVMGFGVDWFLGLGCVFCLGNLIR
jgi:hypothetical protein